LHLTDRRIVCGGSGFGSISNIGKAVLYQVNGRIISTTALKNF